MQILSEIKSKIVRSLTVLLLIGLSVCSIFHSCKNTSDELTVLHGKEFEKVKKIAKKKNKVFAIVLTRPACPPCEVYLKNFENEFKHLSSKTIFNIIDVTLPENEWYMQWLCTGHSPITLVFSPNGELKVVVAGIKKPAIECVESVISGDLSCAEDFFPKDFSTNENHIQTLNALLVFRKDFNKGKDISAAIDVWLNKTDHPYFVYLKLLNEQKQGRHENTVSLAKRFLTAVHDNYLYFRIYHNLLDEVKTVINPNYTPPANEGILSIVEEIHLGDFKLNESRPFSLTLTNTGKTPLTIRDVRLSCSCVKMISERRLTLSPGQSQNIDFVYTADVEGEVFREITFFSNATNPTQRVSIFATVK